MKFLRAIVILAAISLLTVPAMANGKGLGNGEGPIDQNCATLCDEDGCADPVIADLCPCCEDCGDGPINETPPEDGDGFQKGQPDGAGDCIPNSEQ
jgi:hypothetical protein